MKGKLTDQPLVELIREISSKELSGTLRLEQEQAQTAIYFESGQLIFSASNLRTLRLREYLTKRGLLTEKALDAIGWTASDLSLAKRLVAYRTLNQDQVDRLLEILVTDIVRVALLWTDGNWEFDERARLNDPVRVKVDLGNLLREAAHRLPLRFVSTRFQNPNELISRAEHVAADSNFQAGESFILSRLDEPTRLAELVAVSGLRELDAQRMIYGLTLSGLVEREYWQNTFRGAKKPPKEQPKETQVEGAPEEAKRASTGNWGPVSDQATLEMFLERLKRATTHYEIIELPTTAKVEEIKDAYYTLARRYHPDRFHLQSGTTLHKRLSSAFARITQAYEVLTDSASRAAYDATLERSRKFADSASGKAAAAQNAADKVDADWDADSDSGDSEYNFREGFGALQQGRIGAAINHLASAARSAPDVARYRAYYGRALAANEPTRRLAENEIQAAVKLEPSNANYRIMLAELYFELKFHRRAQTELDRAMALDPDNVTASLLLKKLDRSRKTG